MSAPHRGTLGVVAVVLLAVLAPGAAAAPPPLVPAPARQAAPAPPRASPAVQQELSKLWAFVDRRIDEVDTGWRESIGGYVSPDGSMDTRMNANLLTMHAMAALAGHNGLSRRDERIRPLVRLLTHPPAFHETTQGLRPDSQLHAPGWTSRARGVSGGDQHVSIDPQVADGLEAAWRARDVVGLPKADVERIQQVIGLVAWSRFFRFPHMQLNQFNWAASLFESDAVVNRRTSLLTSDYRHFLAQFLDRARRAALPGGSPNLNAGLGFNYLPHFAPTATGNSVPTSEYANIVFAGLAPYELAQRSGMTPLGSRRTSLLREWARRLLAGDWTHAGYLNWDTGLGYERWHLTRYWVFALQGLETLGEAPVLSTTERRWARWTFSRAIELYERLLDDEKKEGDIPSTLFGVYSSASHPGSDKRFVPARIGALVAQAAYERADELPQEQPPSLFAYDPDIRRLAVRTRRYSAAIVDATFRGGYGGADLTRLYDADGRPLGAIGSRGSWGFGLRVSNRGGTALLDSDPGRRSAASARLRGVGRLRGSFGTVGLDMTVYGRGGTSLKIAHRFTSDQIKRTYSVRGPRFGWARVSIPVWQRSGTPAAPPVERGTGSVTVRVAQPLGGYTAVVRAAGGMRTRWRVLPGRLKQTPRTRAAMEVLVPLGAAGARTVTVTITPALPSASPPPAG
ncbi:MAG: hypothetical protein LT070_08920 [Solirubrobacteraceae bacterium]|nr:hypothetical protein [Solirubrobacteraceae bacterium]